MIEINGWVMISESYSEEGEDEIKLEKIIRTLREKISSLNHENEKYILNCLNGHYHLGIMINHNHRSNQAIELFKWIASISIGSYGILHVFDDEDILRNNENKFKIWRMRKGKVEEIEDPFLSPRNPIVEE